jgi:hypothetical protein
MNWEAIGAIGELIAALVVVVTLIYLSVQLRQSIRATHAATFQSATDSFVAINLAIANDESLVRLFSGQGSPETKEDRTRFNFIMLSLFRVRETVFFQVMEGTTDPRAWERVEPGLKLNLTGEHTRAWWKSNAYGFTSEFVAYVDSLLEQAERESLA